MAQPSARLIMRSVRSAVPRSARRALAAIVAFSAVRAAIIIAGYTVRGDLRVSASGTAGGNYAWPASWWNWVTPWWAYAVAVVVGLLGLGLAVLIYPSGHARHERLRRVFGPTF
jgi:hypothetical protein